MSAPEPTPRASLSVVDGVAMLVGIVVGIGIFKTPQMVAANVDSDAAFVAVWLVGGVVTLVGALVYAELGAAFPSTGGEYTFLGRALGPRVALLFAWARLTVIQTGAIALVAFVFGDYAQRVLPLGRWGPSLYAAAAIALFTAVNLSGTPQARGVQRLFSGLTVLAVVGIAVLGLTGAPVQATAPATASGGAAGLAMVFILLTYGGWNEIAYISGELRDVRRSMARVLVLGCGAVTLLYVVANLAFLRALGLEGLRASDAVAADTMRAVFGDAGATVLAATICCTALSTLNATIFTGARLYYAIGRDLPVLGRFDRWSSRGNTPANAILLQSVLALALVGFGAATRGGFQAMVEYTAPVFWFFLLLVGVSLIVLRQREPAVERRFRVPLYPFTPLLFCLTCAYLLYSSVVYAGLGALLGVAVLALGAPLLLLRPKPAATPGE